MPDYPNKLYDERFTARIVENSGQPIIGTDLEGNIRTWNQAAEKLFGYSVNEIIGQDISLIIPMGIKEIVFSQIKTKQICPDEKNTYIRTRQGKRINMEITISPIKDNKGNLIGISFIAKKEKLPRQPEILKILETLNDSIILADTDGSIIFWNQGSYHLFGWKVEEVSGKNFISLFDPDCIPDFSGAKKLYTWEGQSRIITASGEKKYVRVSINTMFDENMEPKYMAVVFTDISEIVEARIEAEKATRSKSEFLANISHEIRTPMSGILGSAELLATYDLDSRQKEYLELIKENGNHLLELIDDILDLSKIEAKRMKMDNSIFDLEEVLKMSTSIFEQEIARKSLDLYLSISPEVPRYFMGDNKHIIQVLNNLLSNAVKFTHQGKIEIKVSKGILEDCVERFPLEFFVQDTGIGISPEKLDLIFEPFTQADSSTTRKYGGTGLGLAISKRLVELMKGKMDVVSELNKGSKFMFTIPVGASAGEIKEKIPDKKISNSKMKNKIMVISSNDNLTIELEKYYQNSPYTFISVINSEKISSKVLSFYRPIAIILDANSLEYYSLHHTVQMLTEYPEILNTNVYYYCDNILDSNITFPFVKIDYLEQLIEELNKLLNKHSNKSEEKKRDRILLVLNDKIHQKLLERILCHKGYKVTIAVNVKQCKQFLGDAKYHLIILDLDWPDDTVNKIIEYLCSHYNNIPIIALRSYFSEKLSRINDYLNKPIKSKELLSLITSKYCPLE